MRQLRPTDIAGLDALDPPNGRISVSWGGHASLAASGTAWATFADGAPTRRDFAMPQGAYVWSSRRKPQGATHSPRRDQTAALADAYVELRLMLADDRTCSLIERMAW